MTTHGGDATHVTDLEIAAYLDRGLTSRERERIENHIAFCDECRGAVVAGRDLARRRTSRSRAWQLAAVAAAAALVVTVGSLDRAAVTDDTPRGDANGTPLAVHGPIVESRSVVRFVWEPAPDVISYRLRLSNAAGATLWTHSGTDTAVALPDSVSLQSGERFFWTVDALLRDGSSRSTGLRQFIRAP